MVGVNGQSAKRGAIAIFRFNGASKGELVAEIHLPYVDIDRRWLTCGESLLLNILHTTTRSVIGKGEKTHEPKVVAKIVSLITETL